MRISDWSSDVCSSDLGLEEGVVVGQRQHLVVSRLRQALAPVADVHAPQPRHAVEDAVAFGVLEPDALGTGDDARAALGGQATEVGEGMQVVGRVAGAPPGVGVRGPGGARGAWWGGVVMATRPWFPKDG